LPANAVQAVRGATGVVLRRARRPLERRAVRLGASTGAGARPLGLAAGERVAVGDFSFKDGFASKTCASRQPRGEP
jgi:hypothetical protein